MATSEVKKNEFKAYLVLLVYGSLIASHMEKVEILSRIGISGLSLGESKRKDKWIFGEGLCSAKSGPHIDWIG
jgi:hypothetical protein